MFFFDNRDVKRTFSGLDVAMCSDIAKEEKKVKKYTTVLLH